MSFTTRHLATDHTLQERVRADPALIPDFVEEMLRRYGISSLLRFVTRDTELRGQALAAGDKVSLWYISANRDEDVFDDPFRFDIERRPNDHLAFGGGGPHFCLGAHIGRIEIDALLREILTRLPDIQPAGPAEWLPSNFISGPKHLPVRFSRPAAG